MSHNSDFCINFIFYVMIDQYLLLFIFYGLSVGASALLYGDTDHAVRMHDIVGELCYRGSLCLVFLHSFDYSVGCSDRLIREYIPDSGILIEYTYIYGKINTDLGSCKCIYEEKRQKFASLFFFHLRHFQLQRYSAWWF